MARRKKQYVPFKIWEARKEDERGYFRFTASQLYSPAVIGLGGSAFKVYVYMRQHSVGARDFEFPRSRYIKFMSPATFTAAVKELEAAGLIEVIEHNAHRQKPNVYRFSAKWKGDSTMNVKSTSG